MFRKVISCTVVVIGCILGDWANAFQTEDVGAVLKQVKSIQAGDLPMDKRVEKVMAAIGNDSNHREFIDTLIWVVTSSRGSKTSDQAAEYLIQHHLQDPRTMELAYRHKRAVLPWVLPMFEALWQSPDVSKSNRPKVLYGLALQQKTISELPATISELSPSDLEQWDVVYGADQMRNMRGVDIKKAEASSLEYFTMLKRDFADMTATKDLTYGTLAERAIFAIENLRIGKVAPDIEGVDLDGVSLKLSDYRGKVVMLCFWGSWCGPCMEMVPHERALVERLDSSKFALVGINSDQDRAPLKSLMEHESITWRSFWCGEKGPLGEIPMQWSVTAWPTVIVLDHEGIIRSQFTTGDGLDAIIDELVAKVP